MKNTSNEYEVLISKKALNDIDDIYSYISFEILEPQIAKNQVERIWSTIFSLSTFPNSHQNRLVGRYSGGTYKQATVDNYIIIFKVDENNKRVLVITIQYVGRNT